MENEDIEKKIHELRKKKEANDRKLWLAKLPEYKKIIGKCFKYRNSYGSSSRDWWLYGKVVGVKRGFGPDDVMAEMIQFQKCSHGRIEFKINDYGSRISDGWTEITKAQYEKERNKLFAELKANF